jgi:lipopolysaccharide transport system ATP-binding protein
MNETVVTVENVSKKFCRDLKSSLWYGMKDLGSELIGMSHSNDGQLRKDEFWAVKDVSFKLKRGDFLGLIGRNGAGKTTLLRMLNGLIKPDKGQIEMRGRVGALIALGAGFNPILTGRENIYVNAAVLGLTKKEIAARFDEIVEFAGLGEFIDMPVQSYSSGMAVRLGFAVATALEPDVLLLDEVLAVGDEGFQKKCLDKMGELIKSGVAILFVSHNMHAISTYSSKVVVMIDGFHREYENISAGISKYRGQFSNDSHETIDKFCSGNDSIRFIHIEVVTKKLQPGDSFNVRLIYETIKDYMDAEVDILIRSNREISAYFQATNKAYKKVINLKREHRFLNINIKDIRINDANGDINIAVWAHHRVELLFWCKIPVEFLGTDHSTGNTFLDVAYDIS